jgi:cytochrome d ubiquinol oxidase subunit II
MDCDWRRRLVCRFPGGVRFVVVCILHSFYAFPDRYHIQGYFHRIQEQRTDEVVAQNVGRSYSISSGLIAFLLGVVLGNVIQGINLGADHVFRGSFIEFLNPYALLMGVTTLSLLMMHGAIYLVMKTENRLYAKLTIMVKNTTIFFVMMILLTSFYTLLYLPHMAVVIRRYPELFAIPVMMVLAIANITRQITKRKYLFAFISSAVTINLLMVLVAMELYPNMLLSKISPANNLTVYNASSSHKTLGIMLIMAAIGVPLVVSYTAFVFVTFKGKVKLDEMSY